MRTLQDLECERAAVTMALVREDCRLGLDAVLSALDTLTVEHGASEAMQDTLKLAASAISKALAQCSKRQSLPEAPKSRFLSLDLVILQHAINGQVDKAIAQTLGQPHTNIHERWRRIRARLGAKDRSNAVGIALALGLISPPEQASALAATLYEETAILRRKLPPLRPHRAKPQRAAA